MSSIPDFGFEEQLGSEFPGNGGPIATRSQHENGQSGPGSESR